MLLIAFLFFLKKMLGLNFWPSDYEIQRVTRLLRLPRCQITVLVGTFIHYFNSTFIALMIWMQPYLKNNECLDSEAGTQISLANFFFLPEWFLYSGNVPFHEFSYKSLLQSPISMKKNKNWPWDKWLFQRY